MLVAICASSQALEEARTALEAEQGRAMRLEVEVAEAQQALGRMEELERELQKYRCVCVYAGCVHMCVPDVGTSLPAHLMLGGAARGSLLGCSVRSQVVCTCDLRRPG